jgi:hypothetical protein
MVSDICLRMPSVRKAREHDCSHSPDDRPVPMSVEAIRKDSVNEMWSGVVVSPCSRNARPQRDGEGAARCPPCSQNPHGETVLVRCAQLRAALATPLEIGIGKEKALARDKARLGALRAGWLEYCAQLGSSPPPLNRDSSRRPCMGQGASQGEESVLADSGRAGEITAGVGRVRTATFLSILRNNSPTHHLQITLIFKPLAS